MGHPLQCGPGFVNIDPMAFDDPATGKHLLYWGSGFEPIKVQELGPDRLSFAPGQRAEGSRLAQPRQGRLPGADRRHLGGPPRRLLLSLLFGRQLLRAQGQLCGDGRALTQRDGTVRDARASDRQAASIVLEKRGLWFAPGHNSVVTDAAGQDWMVYHAVDCAVPREKAGDEPNTRRIMLIDRIHWIDGWPVIDGPSATPQKAPVP